MFDASNPQLMRGYSKSESRKAVQLGFRAAVFLEAEVIQAKHSLTLASRWETSWGDFLVVLPLGTLW